MATAENRINESEVVKLSLVKLEEVRPETMTMVEQAEAFLIESDETLLTAQERVAAAHKRKKFIEGVFAPMKNAAKETKDAATRAYKEVNDLITQATEPLERIKEIYGQKGVAYTREQEHKRREEAQKRELKAKKVAEAQLLAEAEHAEAMGDAAAADAILNEGVSANLPPPPVQPVPKAEGIKYTEHWSAEVVDLRALVKAVAEGGQPLALLDANMTALNQMARALKGAMNVPGVRANVKHNMSPTGR